MEERIDDDLGNGNENGKRGMNLYRTWLYPRTTLCSLLINMDRPTGKKEITASESPGHVGVADGTSPGLPRRSSHDCVRNDDRMTGPRAKARRERIDKKRGSRIG